MSYLLFGVVEASSAAQWFDKDTLFTAAGTTTAVISVTSVLQRLFPAIPARWFALGLSIALTTLAIGVHDQAWTVINMLLAVLNGLMTYAASVGVNTVATPPSTASVSIAPGGRQQTYRWWQ